MATRSEKAEAVSGQARTKSPVRGGRRTTLRVPRALETEVTRTARELEISENEALIRLAQLGSVTAKRHRDVRRLRGRRQAAVAGVGSRRVPFPSSEEMQAAILADRD